MTATQMTIPVPTDDRPAPTCGRCGRRLTDPTSAERGYGLMCWKVVQGEYRAEREARAQLTRLSYEDGIVMYFLHDRGDSFYLWEKSGVRGWARTAVEALEGIRGVGAAGKVTP